MNDLSERESDPAKVNLRADDHHLVRIPLKWGTNYGEVGQRRSEATLVTAMIAEVPHLSQEFCCLVRATASFRFHHLVFLVRFHSAGSGAGFRWEVGRDYGHVGRDSAEVGQPVRGCPLTVGQIISGDDGSAGTAFVTGPERRLCNPRFSSSSILLRTCSQ